MLLLYAVMHYIDLTYSMKNKKWGFASFKKSSRHTHSSPCKAIILQSLIPPQTNFPRENPRPGCRAIELPDTPTLWILSYTNIFAESTESRVDGLDTLNCYVGLKVVLITLTHSSLADVSDPYYNYMVGPTTVFTLYEPSLINATPA